MKKYVIILFTGLMCNVAHAECVANSITYTSCKSGYYLSNGTCMICPTDGTPLSKAKSKDKNTGGITDCYVTSGKDSTGEYTYTSSCYYSN